MLNFGSECEGDDATIYSPQINSDTHKFILKWHELMLDIKATNQELFYSTSLDIYEITAKKAFESIPFPRINK